MYGGQRSLGWVVDGLAVASLLIAVAGLARGLFWLWDACAAAQPMLTQAATVLLPAALVLRRPVGGVAALVVLLLGLPTQVSVTAWSQPELPELPQHHELIEKSPIMVPMVLDRQPRPELPPAMLMHDRARVEPRGEAFGNPDAVLPRVILPQAR